MAQARGDAIEQPVEREREAREVVVRLTLRESAVEVVLAPRLGLRGHLRDGFQSGAKQPARGSPGDDQQHRGEGERREQRRALGLLVRRERQAGDDRPVTAPVRRDRKGVETLVRLLHGHEPASPPDELERRCRRERVRARLLDRAPVLEDPDVAVADGLAERLLEADPPVHDRNLCALRIGPLPQQRVRIVRIRIDEEQVETDRRRGQCDGDGGEDGEQQPRPDIAQPRVDGHSSIA